MKKPKTNIDELKQKARQPTNITVGMLLEFCRTVYGLNRTEFAGVLGMQASHYSEVINGSRYLAPAATRKAFAIGIPAEFLLLNKTDARGDQEDKELSE